MDHLNVKRINSYEYQIIGTNIEVYVTSFDPFGLRPIAKIKGKGARKIKDQVPKLLQEFIKNERAVKQMSIEKQARHYCSQPPILSPGNIYKVEVTFGIDGYGYEDPTVTSSRLMDYESTVNYIRSNRVVHVEVASISNTSIFSIGKFIGSGIGRVNLVREDERFFVLFNGIKLTGLALKELALEGFRFYDLYEDKRTLDTICEEVKRYSFSQVRSVMGLIGEEKVIADIDMVARFWREVERAKRG